MVKNKEKNWQDAINYRHLTEQEEKEMHPARKVSLDMYMDVHIKMGQIGGTAYTGKYAKSWEVKGNKIYYDYYIEKIA